MTTDRRIDSAATTLPGLDRLSEHLRACTRRQGVIAGNLANLDTPGYRPRQLGFVEELSRQVDDGGPHTIMSFGEELTVGDDEVPDQDGNSVSLERQLAAMDENAMQFRGLAEILSRRIGLLRYAAGDGRG